MELRQFVAETLKQVIKGVQDAQNEFPHKQNEGRLMPVIGRIGGAHTSSILASPVHFDVAVTTSATGAIDSDVRAAGSVFVLDASVGGSVNASLTHEHVTRITFDIPVVCPGHNAPALA